MVKLLRFESDAGTTQAVVAPKWGANIIGFSHRARGWQWPVPILETVDLAAIAMQPTSYGIPVLCPLPGRTGRNQSGELEFRGRRYKLGYSRHGVLRHAHWTAEQAGTDKLVCTVQVRPAVRGAHELPDFPFSFDATYEISLAESMLELSLQLTNTGDMEQPLDAGWHPYFARDADATATIPTSARWEVHPDREPTPTGRLLPLPADVRFAAGHGIAADAMWDDVFELDQRSATDGVCTSWFDSRRDVLMQSGRAERLTVRRWVRTPVRSEPAGSAALTHMQLYTPPGRTALCLEPLSAIPNAVNLAGANPGGPITFNTVSPGASIRYHISVGLKCLS